MPPLDTVQPNPSRQTADRAAAPTAAPDPAATASGPAPQTPRAFRPDIQGLRALAVTLVVLYHAHVPGFDGGYVGVDVFFVISGFLITGHLLREVDRTGRVSLLRFYSRRFRRLLPTAATVVLATVVAARIWLPATQTRSLVRDAVYSSFYAINYHLAAQGVNYQQDSAPPSPLQHFWSLAVEEQFYVLWPLLILLCALIGRARYRRRLIVGVLVAVTVVSLWFSITVTAHDAPLAYFALHTRAWELAFGALVAIAAPRLVRIPAPVASALSWAAVATIVASAVLYSDATAFPGSAALAPVGGAAVLIAVGGRRTRGSAEVLLARRPAQGLGKISYSVYLWHWPMLVILPYAAGYAFGWVHNLEIIGLALWVAFLGYWAIENPSLRSRVRSWFWILRGAVLSATMAAAAIVMSLTLPALVGSGAAAAVVTLSSANTAVVTAAVNRGLSITAAPRNLTPRADLAAKDYPLSSLDGSRCMNDFLTTYLDACVYGDPAGTRTAVLYGDSHAQQWLGALDPIARADHWKLVVLNKSACPVADISVYAPALKRTYTECASWRTAAVARIKALRPALLIVSQSDLVVNADVPSRTLAADTLTTVRATGVSRVVYLADTPDPVTDPNTCLQQHLSSVGACSFSRAAAYQDPTRQQQLQSVLTAAGVAYVPTLPWFCTTYCPEIVGNIAVYRDAGHMTNTYSRWLSPELSPLFTSAAADQPDPPGTSTAPAAHA